METKLIMPEGTAVWLVDNTTLTFEQISKFCGLSLLEVQGIADGDVARGIQGTDPTANEQLSPDEIKKGEAEPEHVLQIKINSVIASETKRRGPRYTPLSKRQNRPAAISWLLKNHPELTTAQITKLIGTTKPTITAVRERTHWNINNIQPTDPVALGLCRQGELDDAVALANERMAKEREAALQDAGKTIAPTAETVQIDADSASARDKLKIFSL